MKCDIIYFCAVFELERRLTIQFSSKVSARVFFFQRVAHVQHVGIDCKIRKAENAGSWMSYQ